jgi:hypothetical protein
VAAWGLAFASFQASSKSMRALWNYKMVNKLLEDRGRVGDKPLPRRLSA